MKSEKSVVKWWWSWSADRIEAYLEDMARKGWRLTDAGFGMMNFKFRKDSEQTVRYVFDYNNKADDEYLTILQDAGWERISSSAGWILWRQEYEDERPELFTDRQSLIDRNKRILWLICAMAMMQIPIVTMNIVDRDYSDHRFVSIAVLIIYVPLVALLVYGIVRLFIENAKLKKTSGR